LEVYRPGGQDADDPQFAATLEYLKHDPELKAWFDRQRAFDETMSESLTAIVVPAHLKDAILRDGQLPAEAAAARPQSWRDTLAMILRHPIIPERRILTSPLWQNWQTRAALVGVAVLLLIAVGVWWVHEPQSFAGYRRDLVESSWGQVRHLDLQIKDVEQVKAWLDQHRLAEGVVLPSALTNVQLHGASLMEWRGRQVAFLCFLDGPRHLHLFIGERMEMADEPTPDSPQFEKCEGWRTVSWIQGGNAYILAGMKYPTFIKRFRKGGQWDFSSL